MKSVVLPKREGSLRVRIRIRTKDYKKNIERIIRETNKKYRNIYPREKWISEQGGVNFAINRMSLWDISKMKKDEKKIKIYSEDFLVGIFYLPKQIQVEFFIAWTNNPSFRFVSIHGIWLNSRVEKEKKDYEWKV